MDFNLFDERRLVCDLIENVLDVDEHLNLFLCELIVSF
jgi:hypothetical protein